jgi:tRNA U55 pseudouridine synthase TruB
MQEFSPLDGAILIDKPADPTSRGAVDAIRLLICQCAIFVARLCHEYDH